jgi:hypothetical protein
MSFLRRRAPPPLPRQYNLAAYARGKLRSAFAGKPVENASMPERALGSSRVLVVSSSLFLTNPFAYAGNAAIPGSSGDPQLLMLAQPYAKYLTPMIVSVKNTLDWMTSDDDLSAARSKVTARPRGKVRPKRRRQQN